MKRLLDIQAKLKVPKSQFNKFGNYNYRNLEDILEALKPHLAEQGLVLIISDDIEYIGERYYIKATARLLEAETGKEIATTHAYAREEENAKGMSIPQMDGSTSSYARKYCASAMFLLDDNKDADTNEYHEQNGYNEKYLKELIFRKGSNEEAIKAHYKVKTLSKLNKAQIEEACKQLEKKVDVIH